MTLSEVDGRLCDARLQIPTSEIDDEELTFCGVLVLVWALCSGSPFSSFTAESCWTTSTSALRNSGGHFGDTGASFEAAKITTATNAFTISQQPNGS